MKKNAIIAIVLAAIAIIVPSILAQNIGTTAEDLNITPTLIASIVGIVLAVVALIMAIGAMKAGKNALTIIALIVSIVALVSCVTNVACVEAASCTVKALQNAQ